MKVSRFSETRELAWEQLINGVAEDYLLVEDAKILSEYGDDSEALSSQTYALLKDTCKAYRKRRLNAAAREYELRSQEMDTMWVELPDRQEERRSMLAFTLASQPAMREAFLTLQHRKLKDLTDADVESCLIQLSELGVLAKLEENDD